MNQFRRRKGPKQIRTAQLLACLAVITLVGLVWLLWRADDSGLPPGTWSVSEGEVRRSGGTLRVLERAVLLAEGCRIELEAGSEFPS
ncbi:MAG: hypothetical protein L0Z55_07985, partial [Planctomycetes bacterium]|nr:hypothetical protein [Planctomycetota bacterium]